MLLVGSEEDEDQPTKADMESKSISFDDFLPVLWALATSKDPGSYEDFFEGLKVPPGSSEYMFYIFLRSSTRTATALFPPPNCVTS